MLETIRNKRISMFRGDTLSFGLEVTGLPVEPDQLYFTCRKTPTSSIVFQKSLGHGISRVVGDDIVYRVRVAPEDTAFVQVGTYVYDFQLNVSNDVYTLLSGPLEIVQDITY